jgi:hypothetical protein
LASNVEKEPLDLDAIEERLELLGKDDWLGFCGYSDSSVSIDIEGYGDGITLRRWKGESPKGEALLHANKDIAALVAEVKRLREVVRQFNATFMEP